MILFSYQFSRCILICLVVLVLIAMALLLVAQPAYGQIDEATYELDLATLGYDTRVLNGPIDSISYYFSLPANWVPQEGTYLQLNLAYAASSETGPAPALVEVSLNGELLRTEEFLTSTVTSLKIDIPPGTLRLAEDTRINALVLGLRVSGRCAEDYETTRLAVQSSSKLGFVYRERPLPLDLALYPKPFYYRGAFATQPVRMILPAQPNASELQSAAMIAARLGYLTGHDLPLEVSLSDTLPVTVTQQHLVLIGSPERLQMLSQMDMPLPLRERRMGLHSQMPAAVAVAQPFSYTLIVENTSSVTQSLTVEDRLSSPVRVVACQGCNEVAPGLIRWEIGSLSPGQTVSTIVQARVDDSLDVDNSIEHTASLLDAAGQIINVDTLTATIALGASDAPVSSPAKGPYFFSFDDQGVPETSGVVQLLVSPWSAQRAVIAVTGLDDAAVSLAAHALATQSSMPGMQGQYAIVQATRPITADLASQAQDITLAEMGYSDTVSVGRAGKTRIRFELPRGAVLAEQAYLALDLAHGTALNTISATLELRLNDLPFYSVPLGSENAADNWIEVPLPSQRLRPGINQLDVDVAADWPFCLNGDELARLWVTIYADSFLHLSYSLQEEGPVLNLADYPQFLATDPGLQDVVLLVPDQVTPDEVQGIVQLFSFLGDATQGRYFVPKVALSDQVTPDQWRSHDLIVLGQPSRNPYIGLINEELPQPFIPGRDEIRQQVDNVIYQLPSGYDLGYIQLLPVPWDEMWAMLVVTGTTDAGLRWALHALGDSELSQQLSGNLAVMANADEMHTTDTRQSALSVQSVTPPLASPNVTTQTTLTATPAPTAVTTPEPTPPGSAMLSEPAIPASSSVPEARRPRYRPPLWTIGLLAVTILAVAGALGMIIRQRRRLHY